MPNFIPTPAGFLEVQRAAEEGVDFTTAPSLAELRHRFPAKTNVGRSIVVGVPGGSYLTYTSNGSDWIVGGSGVPTAGPPGPPGPPGGALTAVSFSTTLRYVNANGSVGIVSITSDVTVTADTSGASLFNALYGVFVGDGTHHVTLGSGFTASDSDLGFDPTKRNTLQSFYDGATVLYAWTH